MAPQCFDLKEFRETLDNLLYSQFFKIRTHVQRKSDRVFEKVITLESNYIEVKYNFDKILSFSIFKILI